MYYQYKATCLRILDGDTLELKLELGFGLFFVDKFRLYGVNAPETHGKKSKIKEEKEKGIKALSYIDSLIYPDDNTAVPLRVQTIKDKKDKYGRYLAKIFIINKDGEEICVNDSLIKEGLAVPFMV